MATYITVDSGTTNTRITLVTDGVIVDTLKFSVSVSENETRKECLSRLLKRGIAEILEKNQKSAKDVSRILASGMITSEIGIIELEHINSPCGIDELAKNIYETTIDEISEIPFVFIRGVKYVFGNYIDMMRGEETEIYGVTKNSTESTLYVLPGSHSKLIHIDKNNRIAKFSTELTGEMINVLASHTILSSVIDLSQSAEDAEYLQKGYLASKEYGLNAALFKVRSLSKFSKASNIQILSFFIGIVLYPEIENIIKSSAKKVVIGGKSQLKEPTALLLKMNSSKQIEKVSNEIATNATVFGAVKIYERYLNM